MVGADRTCQQPSVSSKRSLSKRALARPRPTLSGSLRAAAGKHWPGYRSGAPLLQKGGLADGRESCLRDSSACFVWS